MVLDLVHAPCVPTDAGDTDVPAVVPEQITRPK
jgi:hypothetical protein